MKICSLITVICISVTPACTLQPLNLSPMTTNLSALESPISAHCNASASWLPESKSAEDMYPDCYSATLEFLRIADEHGRVVYEFHAAGVRPRHGMRSVTTPSKYTYSTDPMIIPMRNLGYSTFPATESNFSSQDPARSWLRTSIVSLESGCRSSLTRRIRLRLWRLSRTSSTP